MTRPAASVGELPDDTVQTKVQAKVLGALWACLLRVQCATWRVRVEGLEAFDADLARRRGVIAAFWHGTYIPLFVLLRNRDAVVFTSLSRRGAVISEICRRFGYRTVQLHDHGGDASLERMHEALSQAGAGPCAGVAVDGPLGPRHQVKRGAVQLASALGWRIYPISVASGRKRVFTDRWDRRELPKAFSRVAMVVGDPLEPPRSLAEPESWQARLADELAAGDRRAAELVGQEVESLDRALDQQSTEVI